MHRPRGCCVSKLTDCSGDPKPSCRPGAVTVRREFVRALGAFQHRLLAVACKHEVGDAVRFAFGDEYDVTPRSLLLFLLRPERRRRRIRSGPST